MAHFEFPGNPIVSSHRVPVDQQEIPAAIQLPQRLWAQFFVGCPARVIASFPNENASIRMKMPEESWHFKQSQVLPYNYRARIAAPLNG